ncbi:MAG TPA: response regulator, partial [Bdellovibrionota bacterium]|nr:response regulator [Bdellovibrionota bacterium]
DRRGIGSAVFARPASSVIGQSLDVLIPERFRSVHHDHVRRFGDTGVTSRRMGVLGDIFGLRGDGEEFPAEASISQVQTEGERLFTVILRDISDRKRQEAVERRSMELIEQNRLIQEANRLKSEFLANMSHELRTPLNSVIGFAEILHDGKVGAMTPEQAEYLGDILVSGRHLLTLINDVLDLAKVESGKLEFHPTRIDVRTIVLEVLDVLRAQSAGKRLKVKSDVSKTVQEVVVDAGKLKQVLYNFLSNAIKFTPEGGTITVRVLPQDDPSFRIEVEDDGIGISQDNQRKLFLEFQQIDSGIGKKYQGTGLGLALTKKIVQAQGGHVGAKSTPGKGSLFYAVLPKEARAAGPMSTGSTGRAKISPAPDAPLILVVEDDAKDRDWLVQTLLEGGYLVETAATGREATSRCADKQFDAITLDLLLPDVSGLDVLRQIRARGLNQQAPIVVVTIVANKEAVAGFPVHDVLTKPIRAEELLASLEKAGLRPQENREILVVDDDPAALKMLSTLLTRAGYIANCQASSQVALDMALSSPPAAVILDLMMPDPDGFEFVQRLRRAPNGKSIPVIVWTMKDLSPEELSKLTVSAQAIIRKGEGDRASLLSQLKAQIHSRMEVDGAV